MTHSESNKPNNKPLKIVFAGTPDFSATILQSLIDSHHSISAVYCQPDRRVGRGKKLAFGPVKTLASEQQIPVEQPLKFDGSIDESGLTALEKLTALEPDLMIVVAYGLILPQSVLDVPKFGCINIHASLLPRWRGAAPIQRAIQAGDQQTGITIMQMDKGLDTGNMLLKSDCEILPSDTGSTLHDRLAELGQQSIDAFLSGFSSDKGSPLSPGNIQNDELANYAHKLTKAEAEINWSESAADIERKIRAFNAWPISFTHVGTNRLRIWQAKLMTPCESAQPLNSNNEPGKILGFDKKGIQIQCGDGEILLLTHLQADGSRAMSAAELLNSKSQWFIDTPQLGR